VKTNNAEETLETLATLIKSANLTREQRQRLGYLSRGTKSKQSGKHKGPYAHCKEGDLMTVAFPDGVMMQMTVFKVGPLVLRLTTQTWERATERRLALTNRIKRYEQAVPRSPLALAAAQLKQLGATPPPEPSR
jgi:hypothetical protein